ncbi:hypothetical protein J7T55_000692 [Diaporthe amygdali]|uniref:uncharacterized protein n=1 Tax=Phomopsis amygdali TaxID=1214568 RepID=UPI0022FE2A7D|nr:uncharacterized protein J7T55_000692 [Diaporthe amygdali]KAJ0110259.1 hypothetical protein J7T55_000692 [Diaporthe amygdali]
MSQNKAAWLDGKDVRPLAVRPADMPKPGPSEVIVKNHAVAINPLDWKMQDDGSYVGTFPNVIGTDIAGEVYEVGSEVKNFKIGDRVLAHCTGIMDKKPQSGAFQLYTAVHCALTSRIPDSMSFTDATVLPLAISTAAPGLYSKDNLALPLPSATSIQPIHKSILVWGGSSSVGSVTIQLAKASGLTVLATASARNLDALKSGVGVDHAFDYKSPSVVEDIVATVKNLKDSRGIEFAGIYDAISEPQIFPEALGPIFDKLESEKLISAKKLATVLPPSNLPDDVQAKMVLAGMMLPGYGYEDFTPGVWANFVPAALETATLKPLPPPLVVGKGLEAIQEGIDQNKKGVSYRKVVVEL